MRRTQPVSRSSKPRRRSFCQRSFSSATESYSSTTLDVPVLPGFGAQPPTFNVTGSHWNGTLLLGVTVPLYDGGLRRALEGQARADEARSGADLERAREEATREVVSAANNLTTSLAALEASEALVSAAQITFDAALDAYRHGVGSITDAMRAQTALLDAQNTSADSYSGRTDFCRNSRARVGNPGCRPAVVAGKVLSDPIEGIRSPRSAGWRRGAFSSMIIPPRSSAVAPQSSQRRTLMSQRISSALIIAAFATALGSLAATDASAQDFTPAQKKISPSTSRSSKPASSSRVLAPPSRARTTAMPVRAPPVREPAPATGRATPSNWSPKGSCTSIVTPSGNGSLSPKS